jgi:ATP-dependent Clp protease ATP-binding subunit ClpX
VANVPPQGGRKHPEQAYIQIDTTNILFICGGTFSDIQEVISKRIGRDRIGFGAPVDEEELNKPDWIQTEVNTGNDEILRHVSPKDLIEFGMIPEFVGRLPVMVTLKHLCRDDLVRILTEPKNALVRQYQNLFVMEDARLEFNRAGLEEIAKVAIERETGVRALRSILEGILLDVLYELPNRQDERSFLIDAEVVRGQRQLAIGLKSSDVEPPEPESTDPLPDENGPEEEEKRESA